MICAGEGEGEGGGEGGGEGRGGGEARGVEGGRGGGRRRRRPTQRRSRPDAAGGVTDGLVVTLWGGSCVPREGLAGAGAARRGQPRG